MDFVGLAAVERLAFGIRGGGSVLRPHAHQLRRHRGRDDSRVVEEVNARIEIAHAGLLVKRARLSLGAGRSQKSWQLGDED